jgi:hypothetical protein
MRLIDKVLTAIGAVILFALLYFVAFVIASLPR